MIGNFLLAKRKWRALFLWLQISEYIPIFPPTLDSQSRWCFETTLVRLCRQKRGTQRVRVSVNCKRSANQFLYTHFETGTTETEITFARMTNQPYHHLRRSGVLVTHEVFIIDDVLSFRRSSLNTAYYYVNVILSQGHNIHVLREWLTDLVKWIQNYVFCLAFESIYLCQNNYME